MAPKRATKRAADDCPTPKATARQRVRKSSEPADDKDQAVKKDKAKEKEKKDKKEKSNKSDQEKKKVSEKEKRRERRRNETSEERRVRKEAKRLKKGQEADAAEDLLALSWASSAWSNAVAQVPAYADGEEALRRLPARFEALEEAELPEDGADRRAALEAMATLVTGVLSTKQDIGHFVRSLQVAVLERKRQDDGLPLRPDVVSRPAPLKEKAQQKAPARVSSALREQLLHWDQELRDKTQASTMDSKQTASTERATALPPPSEPREARISVRPSEPELSVPKAAAQESDSSDSDSEAQASSGLYAKAEAEAKAKAEAEAKAQAKAQRMADSAAADKVYLLCKAMQDRKPVIHAGVLQEPNLRAFFKELRGTATQAVHWEQAWQQMLLPEQDRVEAGRICVHQLLDLSAGGNDEAATSALALAHLSRGHRIKIKIVEEVLAENLGLAVVREEVQEVMSWLLFHWFPQGKTAGWGWWRVGWSWNEWWKSADRLLSAFSPANRLGAFKSMKAALEKMQDKPSQSFQGQPWTPERRDLLLTRLRSLMGWNEEKLKEELSPLDLS